MSTSSEWLIKDESMRILLRTLESRAQLARIRSRCGCSCMFLSIVSRKGKTFKILMSIILQPLTYSRFFCWKETPQVNGVWLSALSTDLTVIFIIFYYVLFLIMWKEKLPPSQLAWQASKFFIVYLMNDMIWISFYCTVWTVSYNKSAPSNNSITFIGLEAFYFRYLHWDILVNHFLDQKYKSCL